MRSNIEIKAIARDYSRLKEIAETISDTDCLVLRQEDVFFHSNSGRLKLRIFSEESGELIYYERADSSEPKQSRYIISKTAEPASLKAALATALGIKTIVRKRRLLFIVGQTRIHLDEVEDLGNFVELEFVMKPDQDIEEGIKIARELMSRLEIMEDDLIEGAYADMISEKTA